MKTKGFLLIIGAVVLLGCDTGDTPIETYKPAPGQVTNPSAPPAQAAPKDSSDALQGNSNLPPAARNALTHGGK